MYINHNEIGAPEVQEVSLLSVYISMGLGFAFIIGLGIFCFSGNRMAGIPNNVIRSEECANEYRELYVDYVLAEATQEDADKFYSKCGKK